MFRCISLGVLILLMAGCGFHLRGAVVWPQEYQNVYMAGYDPANRHSFFASIKRFFPKNVNIVNSEAEADVIIRVLSESQSTRRVSGLAKDADIEEVITLIVAVDVVDRMGRPILPATILTRERDFTYSESDLLGKSTDLQSVFREVRQELGAMFMRRLEAAMRSHVE